MKPANVALLCLGCCLASVVAAYAVFVGLHEAPAKHVAFAPDDSIERERVSVLERQVSDLRDEIARLDRQDPLPGPTGDAGPIQPVSTKPVTSSPAAQPATGQPGDVTLADLSDRIAEIETGEAAARTVRDKAILELNGQDRNARNAASNLLVQFAKAGDKLAQKALTEAARSEDPSVRNEAIEAMGKTGMVEFLPALMAAADDELVTIRDEVAEALRRMPADQAGPHLVSMLKDPNSRVLLEAMDAIADLNYAEGQAALRELTSHQDEPVAIDAALALKRLGDPGGAEGWVPTLGFRLSSTDVSERRVAMQYLRRLKMESSRTYLQQALSDTDSRVRRDAQRAINELDAQLKK